jgi:hypothetical protein
MAMAQRTNIDLTATEDREISHIYGEETISEPLGTISVSTVTGGLNVISAVHATEVEAVGGEVRINAQTIDFARSVTGSLCLSANHMGDVVAEGNPVQTLMAYTIDSIAVIGRGTVHITGAVVGELKPGATPIPHLICLHKGAKILNLNGNSPDIIDPNCK